MGAKNGPLTDEQSKLAGDNYPLALSFTAWACSRWRDLDRDEVQSAAAEGLLYAARRWKPGLGAFGGYAWRWMRQRLQTARLGARMIRLPRLLEEGRDPGNPYTGQAEAVRQMERVVLSEGCLPPRRTAPREDTDERDRRVWAALGCLDGTTREVVKLCALDELSAAKAAAELGISPDDARRRRRNGMAVLRRRLTGLNAKAS